MILSSIPPEAAWGFFGALCYAAQNYSACLFAHRATKGHWRWCTLDMVIALTVGTVGAAAFTPWVAEMLGASDHSKLPGVAVLIGLLANGVKPVLIEQVPKGIFRWIASKGPPA